MVLNLLHGRSVNLIAQIKIGALSINIPHKRAKPGLHPGNLLNGHLQERITFILFVDFCYMKKSTPVSFITQSVYDYAPITFVQERERRKTPRESIT